LSEKLKTAGAKKTKRPSEKTGNLKKTWKKSKTLGFGPNPFPPTCYIFLQQYRFTPVPVILTRHLKKKKEILLSH